MLHNIEVEIDDAGNIEVLDPIGKLPSGRGLLTLLPVSSGLQEMHHGTDSQPLSSLFGILKAERSATLEEMQAAVKQRAAERYRRDRD